MDYQILCDQHWYSWSAEIRMNPTEVWVTFRQPDEVWTSFVATAQTVDFLAPLPGQGFSGQSADGTLYRSGRESYSWRTQAGWMEQTVPNLPLELDPDPWRVHIFEPKLEADGELSLVVHEDTGGEHGTASVHWTTRAADQSWSTPVTFAHTYSEAAVLFSGFDAADNPAAIIGINDTSPPILLLSRIEGEAGTIATDDFPEYDSVTQIADSPRPVPGGSPALAILRAHEDRLELLAVNDIGDVGEHTIDAAVNLRGGCPNTADPFELPGPLDEPCPPCQFKGEGIERDAYDITRTSGGQLWASWVTTTIDAAVTYELIDAECVGQSDIQSSGVLHLVELDHVGSIERELALPLPDLTLGSARSGYRGVYTAAFGDHVAVFGLMGGPMQSRVLVFDTTLIE
jgi:hypothetical protein